MPFTPRAGLPRCAVVDLGSNSVRLVVYEGLGRNPMSIFNEKAVLRLGRGLLATGMLDPDGMDQAMTILHRYRAVAQAMGANPIEVLATAAVRDARNGSDFVRRLQAYMPDVPVRILSGVEEAEFSSDGLLCGIPGADGVLADIGGGSLELVRLDEGHRGTALTLPLGVIRLSEQSGGDPSNARLIVEGAFRSIGWLNEIAGRDLYLVGGAWRALARIDMARTDYSLRMVHHYIIGRDQARDLCARILSASNRELAQMAGISRRRVEDLPFAAVVLRRLVRMSGARRVVFSASGLREGWLMRLVPPDVRDRDSLLAAGHDLAELYGRDPSLPPALLRWTAPLFPFETAAAARLREAACWMSDVGSHDHPEFRPEQAFLRILRQPGIGLDHPARAYLALTIALRYEADVAAPFLTQVRRLLDPVIARRAEHLGMALRLAYTLSAGTPDLLAGTRLRVEGQRLVLSLAEGTGVFAGEAVIRRLTRLAQALDLEAATESVPRRTLDERKAVA
jgi:exopolyphosphatase/guanosine-5'-triphosphate,3'-diphosphate pyrophosphatase